MTQREQLVTELEQIGDFFRRRLDGASKVCQERYSRFADTARRASVCIYSDGETIKEYEAEFDKLEDDGK